MHFDVNGPGKEYSAVGVGFTVLDIAPEQTEELTVGTLHAPSDGVQCDKQRHVVLYRLTYACKCMHCISHIDLRMQFTLQNDICMQLHLDGPCSQLCMHAYGRHGVAVASLNQLQQHFLTRMSAFCILQTFLASISATIVAAAE